MLKRRYANSILIEKSMPQINYLKDRPQHMEEAGVMGLAGKTIYLPIVWPCWFDDLGVVLHEREAFQLLLEASTEQRPPSE